jgi:Zn finger protein HypA/HybF involved in hydrogenase expression
MDLQLVENWIWDRFASVADQTRLEWVELQHTLAERERYHTGEIAAPGALTCDNCGAELHFEKPGHIPPCPKCSGTLYRRPSPEA